MHNVFSTEDRRPLLRDTTLRQELRHYLDSRFLPSGLSALNLGFRSRHNLHCIDLPDHPDRRPPHLGTAKQ